MEEQLREAILACEYANDYHNALGNLPKELRGTSVNDKELDALYRKMMIQVHKALKMHDAMNN